tara:strand:- start:94 stop:1380 length:1287 start_codon:yes stop_codon:yes gene_type:complete
VSTLSLPPTDLPLGTIAPEAPYNRMLAERIEAQKMGRDPTAVELQMLKAAQTELFSWLDDQKEKGIQAYAKLCAERNGFVLTDRGTVDFPWKATDHRRIGFDSDFYAPDLAKRELAPVQLEPTKPRVIVFATGRAFAEKNARLLHLTTKQSLHNAKNVMSAQAYLVGSRLVPGYPQTDVQVSAVAYDMVTSEIETPALRIQAILDPSFMHPVSRLAAERIFGPCVARAHLKKNGTFRRDTAGRILAEPLSKEQIINSLSKIVLVGGSVGCLVCFQALVWLREILDQLGVDDELKREAVQSILCLHLGPTTVIPADPDVNLLSVVNVNDEFLLSGNDIRAVAKIAADRDCHMVTDPVQPNGRRVVCVIDVPGTLFPKAGGGFCFDPVGTHFGHSLKHYANRLRALGLSRIVGRAIEVQGGFILKDLLDD